MLNCSQSFNNVEVFVVLLNLWAIPTLKTLLAYTLFYYIAEQPQVWGFPELYPV